MRKPFSSQQRLDCNTVLHVPLNLECRDEIIPILRALQHIYSKPTLRDEILRLIADDVNKDARDDCGRDGLDYWQILVLAAVRLGCNLDYDKLQDLAEQHQNRFLYGTDGERVYVTYRNRMDGGARTCWPSRGSSPASSAATARPIPRSSANGSRST